MQKLQLSIPEPCHENWQQMTPTEQGRFCNACAKEVIDFSTMSDIQVLNYFTNLTHEKVCGRALPEQLDRAISRPAQPKKRLFWYWNYMVMFFMFFTKGNNAAAQSCTKPATELSPTNNLELGGKMITKGEVNSLGSRVISGKITDIDGNPLSFATVKIKGTNSGVVADANGNYSMKGYPNSILVISGAGFKETEVSTGSQSVFNTVLEKTALGGLELITVGGAFWRNPDEYYGALDKLNRVAVLHVKDETTGKAIPNVSIIIKSDYTDIADTIITDKKGMYKIKGIKDGDKYEIKIVAEGYVSSEFTIDEYDFKNRKKEWEVLLRKKKPENVRSSATATIGKETVIRIRCENSLGAGAGALYVVDGTIAPTGVDINPDDIENYSILQAPQAMAIFGEAGKNGAVVITTRKAKEISLNEVVVNSGGLTSCSRTAGGISYTSTYENSFLGDTIATIKTLLTNSIKVYPNPIQRNTAFSVELQLKQAGNYSLQLTDASGRILLQQKFNANTKNHTEKIMSDGRWAVDIYYIRVFDAQNKLISKSSFIVQ